MSVDQLNNDVKAKAKKQLMNATDPVEKCKLALLARGCKGIKSCGRYFRIMDDDGNKKLNKEEFKTGMGDFLRSNEKITLSKEDLEEVFDRFDSDNSGSIDVNEFLLQMQPRMNDNRMKLVLKAFDTMDKTGEGILTVDDLKNVYDVTNHPKFKSGEWTQKQCLEEFLKVFDSKEHQDNKVTKDEFIAYYSAISCGIDHDAYFDLMMRQAYKGLD